MQFIIVFLLVTVVDFFWAMYIKHTANSNALLASIYGAAISLISGLITLSYVADHMMIIPACLGAFVGTYLCVKYGHKK